MTSYRFKKELYLQKYTSNFERRASNPLNNLLNTLSVAFARFEPKLLVATHVYFPLSLF